MQSEQLCLSFKFTRKPGKLAVAYRVVDVKEDYDFKRRIIG